MADPRRADLSIPSDLLVLTLDIGSSSTRAALYDAAGTLLPGTLVRRESAFYPDAERHQLHRLAREPQMALYCQTEGYA